MRICSRSFLRILMFALVFPFARKIPPATQATKQSDQEAKLFLSEMNCNKRDSAYDAILSIVIFYSTQLIKITPHPIFMKLQDVKPWHKVTYAN